jgi:two-component system chemotaxis response regulator CheV
MNAVEVFHVSNPGEERMEAVWRDRADRLSQRTILDGVGKSTLPIIVLGVATANYGVRLSEVAEVLAPVRVTPVPGAAAMFSGVINVHGEIRPVIDLRRLLGMEKLRDGGRARVILLSKQGREIGLQVDSVEQIRWIAPGDVQPVGSAYAGSCPYIAGSTKDLLIVLSMEAIFAELGTGVTT